MTPRWMRSRSWRARATHIVGTKKTAILFERMPLCEKKGTFVEVAGPTDQQPACRSCVIFWNIAHPRSKLPLDPPLGAMGF